MTDTNIETALVNEIRTFVADAKQQATVAVNATLAHLYWQIVQRINQGVLGGERAAYGKQVIGSLAQRLIQEFVRGFSEKLLRQMMQLAVVFPEQEIVARLWRRLSWTILSN